MAFCVVSLSCVAVASSQNTESKGEAIANVVNVNIENQPLNEALKILSRQFSFDIKGIPIGNEAVSMNLSGLPLEEALKKVLRGYNYVFIKPENTTKSIVMVLSKSERTKYSPPPPQPTVAAMPTPPPAPIPQTVQQPMVSMPAPQTSGGLTDKKRDLDNSGASISQTATGVIPVASSGGTTRQQAASSTSGGNQATLFPPMPPQIAGLDLPPMPPGMTDTTTSTTPTTTGTTITTGTTTTTTAIATGTTTTATTTPPSNQTTTTTKPGEPYPRPPQVPF